MSDTTFELAMNEPIVARLVTPTVIAVQLGALVTVLFWVNFGWPAGLPTLAVSLVVLWRAARMGFTLDERGLHLREFLPGASRVVPWSELRSVDVDVVVVGTETRSRKPRIRFFTEPHGQLQVIGCKAAAIDAALERFRARGLDAQDHRAPAP